MLLITEELRDEIIEWLKLEFAEGQDLLETEPTGSAVVKVVEVLSDTEAVVVFPAE